MTRLDSQCAEILRHLKRHRCITPLQALRKPFRCMRLGARIYDLRRDGHDIATTMIEENGKRFAEYRLVKAA